MRDTLKHANVFAKGVSIDKAKREQNALNNASDRGVLGKRYTTHLAPFAVVIDK